MESYTLPRGWPKNPCRFYDVVQRRGGSGKSGRPCLFCFLRFPEFKSCSICPKCIFKAACSKLLSERTEGSLTKVLITGRNLCGSQIHLFSLEMSFSSKVVLEDSCCLQALIGFAPVLTQEPFPSLPVPFFSRVSIPSGRFISTLSYHVLRSSHFGELFCPVTLSYTNLECNFFSYFL